MQASVLALFALSAVALAAADQIASEKGAISMAPIEHATFDTEDVLEMRALRDIDAAFLCMKSDLARFKELVAKNPGIEVRLLDWYGPTR